MMKHRIYIMGCDDTTKFEMDLTDEEAAFVRRMAELANAARTSGCMPEMEIEVVEQVREERESQP